MGEVDNRINRAIEHIEEYLKAWTDGPIEAVYVLVEVISRIDREYRKNETGVENLVEKISDHLRINEVESTRVIGREN